MLNKTNLDGWYEFFHIVKMTYWCIGEDSKSDYLEKGEKMRQPLKTQTKKAHVSVEAMILSID